MERWKPESGSAPGVVGDALLVVQVFEDLLGGAERLLEDVVDADQPLHRLEQHDQGDDEAGEVAGGEFVRP